MATITYITHDGDDYEADLVEGKSLMQTAVDEAVPGIDGDCGGEAACGTCHVIVDPAWIKTVRSGQLWPNAFRKTSAGGTEGEVGEL